MLPGSEALLRAQLALRLDTLLRQGGPGVTGPQPARAVAPVANDPRLPSRAALDLQAQAGPLTAGARETRQQEIAAAAHPPVPARPDAPAQLSETALALATLLDPQESPEPQPVRGAAPLWTSPAPPPAPELARALARAVEHSGLFYESHLQQFAQGTRTLAQLQREPQALLQHAAAPQTPADGSAPPRTADVAPAAAHTPVVHPASTEVVQQQLQLLASGEFRWQGEPWPGARMDWQVREEAAAPAPEAPGRAWTTRLQVVLPALGEVEATLRLDANGMLQVRVGATDPDAARALQAGRAGLAQRLDAAGLAVQSCLVEGA